VRRLLTLEKRWRVIRLSLQQYRVRIVEIRSRVWAMRWQAGQSCAAPACRAGGTQPRGLVIL
jgi:hypothetical protein